MDTHLENEDEKAVDLPVSAQEWEYDSSSRKSSLKEPSDGQQASYFDHRDSDTISESEEEYIRKMLSDRRGSFRPQPKGTVPYEVQSSDTLEGIAARYNVTPSELTVLNKLSSRMVFPGQIIYIPEKNSLQALEEILKESAASVSASSIEQGSPKPGRVERVPGASASADDVFSASLSKKDSSDDSTRLAANIEDSLHKESLRINSKYVTDGEGVVSGVLIVTTNHIIFDPNVSDPLVIEYGMDKYGVEAPMGCIVKAALYTDIFRIKKDAQASADKISNVYHSKGKSVKKSKSHDEKLDKFEKLKQQRRFSSSDAASKRHEFKISGSSSFQDNLSKICETADDAEDDDANTPNVPPTEVTDDDQKTVDENKNTTVKPVLTSSSSVESDDAPASRKASMSDEEATITFEPLSTKKKSNFEKTKHKIHKGFRKLSITDTFFPNTHSGGRRMSLPIFASLPDFKLKSPGVKPSSDKLIKSSDEIKTTSGAPTYVNMVEEKPELFAPLDKLIPRPAKSFCDTPLYLCLRMGMPTDKSVPRSNPVVHFGQKMKSEYWFSIPKDNVDSLYNFFLRWCPEKYGEIDNINYEELGYISVESDEQDQPESKVSQDQRRASWAFPWKRKPKDATDVTAATSSSPEDWEFLDYLGSTNYVHVPELLTPSTILNEDQIFKIAQHLPARAMNSWALIYSSTAHGFNLKTMYRKMSEYDSPVLIVIANRSSDVFGALLSSPLKISDHFYGTGESFLFTFSPEFKVYRWSGENNYFIKGNTDSFMIGSSEGHFGLWLDDDLFRGRTNSCQTFANEPLCAEQDFEIKALEAWGFV